MSTTKIIVCCHKPDIFKSDNIYIPIHVGKVLSKYDLGIQDDATGDNISSLNSHFCELTGLYWAWKNLKRTDYVGLCHYRRYFAFHEHTILSTPCCIKRSYEFKDLDLNIPNMDKLFAKYDIILPMREVYQYSIAIAYSADHISDDLKTLKEVIAEKYPDYIPSFDFIFRRNNKFSPYNMMIMRWEDFQKYCKWLFDILFELSARINIDNYNPVQTRIWGYLGERLLNVYVYKNKMKPKYYPVYLINDTKKRISIFRLLNQYIRREISFNVSKPLK